MGPPEEAHFLEYLFVVFRVLKLDNCVPLRLVDVSPDLRSVVVYVDSGLLNNLLSDLVRSHVILGEAVEENSVCLLLHAGSLLFIIKGPLPIKDRMLLN